jgi:broad specificity phosphatase PhoE
MSRESGVTRLDLLRHGPCEGGEIFRGSIDVPLTEEGWQQMQASVELEGGADGPWQRIISSPLQRCRSFAGQLAEQRQLPLVVFEELREIHFGDWEGVLRTEVQAKYGARLSAFWRDPVAGTPPNGEPYLEFHGRVKTCLQQLLEQYAGEDLLLISHGAVIRVIMCELLGMPKQFLGRISVPYACMTRFRVHSSRGGEVWAQLCFHRGD